MKTRFVIVAALMLSFSAFAQKDELKALKKLSGKEATSASVQESKKLIADAEGKIDAADNEQKVQFYFYKGEAALNNMMLNPNTIGTEYPVALESFDKAIELEKNEKRPKLTESIKQDYYPKLRAVVLQRAGDLSKEQKFAEAATLFKAAYDMDKTDQVNLYNAAAMAVNAQDFDQALNYYLELDKLGFTGEGTIYMAKNADGVVEQFPNKQLRDVSVLNGGYSEPTEQQIPSVKGEIVKNIALIYNSKGETEKAKQAIIKAKKENPDDVNLIITEAELYLKTKDTLMYKNLIKDALVKNPNNAELFFNLGVITSKTDKDEAMKLYQKSLDIKPDNVNALINLSILNLKDEQKIVDEMNGLGNSAADNKRYEVLKKQRDALYAKALPYLEKAEKIEPKNQDVLSLLATMYQALERMDDYKKIKARMQ
ncbi:tetratricopeptide repeat protein [Flavobacterium rhizosphaerae]|uniref:Tetratricopeptide repeat protein n=1 Tax=Flavobacterium rhizosphaerae TaxID=3163298 RepID=A0ABW8YTH3_9FLAO